MEFEKQVCSLELSKKLKELGVEQDSLFYWRDNDGFQESDECDYSIASAFTVAELGEMLPFEYISIKHSGDKSPSKRDFYCCYLEGLGYSDESQSAYTEADARAKMLIYLVENKLINLEGK